MDAAMYKALSGAIVQMRRLESATQDLSNVNTYGYKGQRLAFNEVLAAQAAKERSGGLVALGEQRTDHSQGTLQQTGNPLDVALEGAGFFVVNAGRGDRYTRAGRFALATDGTLIAAGGGPVMGEKGAIRLTGKVEILPDGMVTSDGAEVDKLRIVVFADPKKLVREEKGLFKGPQAEASISKDVKVVQGNLEESNVSPIEAMIHLITIQRQFESYDRVMRSIDSATEKILAEAGR